MKRDFETDFIGFSFIAAALMLWAGWMLLPRHVGTYFIAEDFPAIYEQVWFWIWMFRIHIFGLIVTIIALIALASVLSYRPYRVMVWPGVAVAAAGTFTTALASAFYFHHGALGAGQLHGASADAVQRFIASLLLDTEYITCLVRFGRVFSGLGLLLFEIALVKWRLLNVWIGGLAAVIGVAAMAVTMGRPDDLQLYMPIFHIHALWLALVGISIFRGGVRVPEAQA